MENKKSNNIAVCIICSILTAFGIAVNIVSLASGGKGVWIYNDVIDLAVSAFIGYYAFIGYKKPHGNLLKCIILLSAVTNILAVYQFARINAPFQAVVEAIVMGLRCYVAGRLHRVKQNMVFISIVTAVILAGKIIAVAMGNATIGTFAPLVIWIDIFVAYVLRYKAHREAGLADAAETK